MRLRPALLPPRLGIGLLNNVAAVVDTTNALLIEGGGAPPHQDGVDGSKPLIRLDSGGGWALHNRNFGNSDGMFRASCAYVPPGAPSGANCVFGFGQIDATQSVAWKLDLSATASLLDSSSGASLACYTMLTGLPVATGGGVTYADYGVNGGAGYIYIFGGITSSYAASAAIQRYSIAGNSYTTLSATLPTAVGQVGGAARPSTGGLYVVGGTINPDRDPPGYPGVNTVTSVTDFGVFNPSTETYTALTALPVAIAEPACAWLDDELYVIGGTPTGNALTGWRRVYRYSPTGNSWTRLNDFPYDTASGVACVKNGILLAGGGWDATGWDLTNNHASDLIKQYSKAGDSWSAHSTLAVPVAASLMVPVIV